VAVDALNANTAAGDATVYLAALSTDTAINPRIYSWLPLIESRPPARY